MFGAFVFGEPAWGDAPDFEPFVYVPTDVYVFAVPAENRVFPVPDERRLFTVPVASPSESYSGDRVFYVPADSRVHGVKP